MENLLQNFVIVFTIIFAAVSIFAKNTVSAVLALAIMSIGLTASFYILQAPDVAMAEAVVGAGISTGLFLFAIKKINDMGEGK